MKPISTLIPVIILGLLFGGCSNKQAQNKKYYRLPPAEAHATKNTTKALTLVIRRPSALSILGGRPIVATQADGSLIQLSHNFWLESPKVLLQDRLVNWATDHWEVVNHQVPRKIAHQILETRILAFEKNQQVAKVTLEFSLYDDENQLLFNHLLSATQNLEEDGYQAFVKATGVAIDSILAQLSTELAHVN